MLFFFFLMLAVSVPIHLSVCIEVHYVYSIIVGLKIDIVGLKFALWG